MTRLTTILLLLGLLAAGSSACSSGEADSAPTTTESGKTEATQAEVMASDIPVAYTPTGGYGQNFPAPVLATCREPLAEGAPDMRGMWQAVAAEKDGVPLPPDSKALSTFQRIEQCGDRVTITAGGIIHDMRADGTELNGVHDVAEFDYSTPVNVVASFENGVHVLRPIGTPLEVTRERSGEQLIWNYLGTKITLERIGEADAPPPTISPESTPTTPPTSAGSGPN
ncbi:unannotated protein [freshwater metagenome]|uniref:Unannotated protein n=1 Tax=freshwater metagenome TaxID=449393 RepID=A0A6J7RRB3_9ZZZZ|nr:hypothetical protein [Actinomycetota bacterium]